MFKFNFNLDKSQRIELFILFVSLIQVVSLVFIVGESYSLLSQAETQIQRLASIDAQLDKVEHKLDKAISVIQSHE
ncbi:hypothetical protein [Helicobacter suis]|uniref:hypothetical protein n=1 Tax=Helicobacter suis TaxID=104628 RepID=UPI0013D5B8AF|nr:hypothetical protein [Helicobacter suis]